MANEESQEEQEVDREFLDSLADDTLSIFKIDLTLIAVYGSILAILLRTGSNQFVSRALDSLYTIFGLQFLLGSILAVALIYVWVRALMTRNTYRNNGKITDEEFASYALGSGVVSSVMAVFLLLAGVIDGGAPGGIPIKQFPMLFFVIFPVVVVFDLLVMPQLLVRLWRRAREKLRVWWNPSQVEELVEQADEEEDSATEAALEARDD
jgi:hypothetical protein